MLTFYLTVFVWKTIQTIQLRPHIFRRTFEFFICTTFIQGCKYSVYLALRCCAFKVATNWSWKHHCCWRHSLATVNSVSANRKPRIGLILRALNRQPIREDEVATKATCLFTFLDTSHKLQVLGNISFAHFHSVRNITSAPQIYVRSVMLQVVFVRSSGEKRI